MPNFEDFGAERRNAEDCERIADQMRAAADLTPIERLPAFMELLETARHYFPQARNLQLVVRGDILEGDAVAFPNSQEIHVDMNFVDGALADSPAVRFIGVHELMHIIFHRGAPQYFKKRDGNVLVPFLRDQHETAEWQADRLARAFFMPWLMVQRYPNALELASAAGVPLEQAQKRIAELTPPKQRPTPPTVSRLIAELERKATRGTAAQAQTDATDLKLRLWNALPAVPGEDAAYVRKCGSFQIH